MHLEEDTFHNRLDWKLWHQVLRHAYPYKRFLVGIALLAVTIATCEACFALVTRWAIDDVSSMEEGFSVLPYVSAYMGLALTLVLGVWGFIILAGGLSHHMSHDIRRDTFKRLQELEFAYFDHRPTGWLISRLTSDCDKLSRIIAWSFLDLVWASSLILAISVILLSLNLKLGLLVLSVVPPLMMISSWFQKRLLLSSRKTRQYNSFITASFSEGIQGLKTTKTFVREETNLKEFSTLSDKMYDYSVLNAIQSAIYLPIVLTIGSVAAGLVLWIGGGDYLAESLTLGTLIAFIFYSGQFFDPINQIAAILVQLQGAQAAGERVLSLLATEPKIRDSDAVLSRLSTSEASAPESTLAEDGHSKTIRQIEFRNVSFSYKEDEPILEDFNFLINPGETIALVGASGGGKSTIVSLLARFYEPTGGGIYIDGIEYRERSLDWYQSNLGIVLQSPHLFAGTVKENILYGRLDATQEEIEEAARLVNAHAFIEKLENGYETDVGEGGNRLSTGQKQLVSFARAILANPQIFIMDEATSSIDTETEALIQAGLHAILHGRISFVIAHRLSTIRSADKILVIERGQILEYGSHSELMSRKGPYYALYTRQFRTETEASVLDRVGG
ncbi:ABC transporter ATP-binding protein [Puniceicoccales bacterium CK1056]|uniref:ABC transporter ATP-binding protein n=1 Tax=Oceanipulchritudo coccoides TaxID=2706888 RepID=A0A6B2LYM9_9BACT|nr:ABC transporter ATP-binding protein [Oceanipulchritudo coccoides]NDV61513.1 ABC transporter ATP-binding protein [Oceanipulchritudo coccoides]